MSTPDREMKELKDNFESMEIDYTASPAAAAAPHGAFTLQSAADTFAAFTARFQALEIQAQQMQQMQQQQLQMQLPPELRPEPTDEAMAIERNNEQQTMDRRFARVEQRSADLRRIRYLEGQALAQQLRAGAPAPRTDLMTRFQAAGL